MMKMSEVIEDIEKSAFERAASNHNGYEEIEALRNFGIDVVKGLKEGIKNPNNNIQEKTKKIAESALKSNEVK